MTDRKSFLKSKRKTTKLLKGEKDGDVTSCSDRYDIDASPVRTKPGDPGRDDSSSDKASPAKRESNSAKPATVDDGSPARLIGPPIKMSTPLSKTAVERSRDLSPGTVISPPSKNVIVSPAKEKPPPPNMDVGTPSKSKEKRTTVATADVGSPDRLTTAQIRDEHVFTPPRPPGDKTHEVVTETRVVKTKKAKRARHSSTATSLSSSSVGGTESDSRKHKKKRKKGKRAKSSSPQPGPSCPMSPLPYQSNRTGVLDSDSDESLTLARFKPLAQKTSVKKSRKAKRKSKGNDREERARRVTECDSSSPPPVGRRASKTKRKFPKKKVSKDGPEVSTGDKVPTVSQEPAPRADSDSSLEENFPVDENDDLETAGFISEDSSDDSDGEEPADAVEEEEEKWRLSNTSDLARFTLPNFAVEAGPTFRYDTPEPELTYFLRFISPKMISIATRETNKYQRFHEKFIAKKRNPKWTIVSDTEMRAFIGCTILMGVDRKPSIEDYWSNSDALYNVAVSKVMTRARYQMIRRYFHISDPYDDPRREPDPEVRLRRTIADPLYKINPWLGPMVEHCLENYRLHQHVSIDEGMVKFKGRSIFKQRMPQKPDKDGFKIWQLADSITSYVANIEPYLGIKYKSRKEGRKKQKGAVKEMTLRLCQPLHGNNHVLHVDSLFAKIDTALELARHDVHMVGSFRYSRKTLPPQLVPQNPRKKFIKMDTGQMLACTWTHPDEVLNITAYQDRKTQIFILNTVYYPLATITSAEDDTVADDESEIPVSLGMYRRYMGGVDRANQKRKYYHTGRKNNRYWTYLVWYLVDVALVNSYECFKHHYPETKLTHKFFHINAAKQLIGGYCSRNQRGNREATKQALTNVIQPENLGMHKQVKFQGRQKGCKECSKRNKKTPSGRVPETIHGCDFCGVHLHKGSCFAAFHHRLLLRGRRSVAVQVDLPRGPPMRRKGPQSSPPEPRAEAPRKAKTPAKHRTPPSPPKTRRKGKKRRS